MIGMLLLAIVVIFAGIMAMRVVPPYIQYFTIKKMVEETMDQPDLQNVSDLEIRDKFSKQLSVNDVTVVTARDLLIERGPQGVVAKLSYSVRKPLVGQASICLDFDIQAGGK